MLTLILYYYFYGVEVETMVYPKFHWLRKIAIFGPDSIRDQKGAMANTK